MEELYWRKRKTLDKMKKNCLPEKKEGLGFRLLQVVSMALLYKLWWNFRTKDSIWS